MEYERYELIYKFDGSKNYLRLIGEDFFKRNQKLGHFLYRNRKIPLVDKIETKNIKEKDQLKIYLLLYKIIYNKSNMFNGCTSLKKFSNSKVKDNENSNIFNSQFYNIKEDEGDLFDFYNESEISENSLYQTINEFDTFSNYSSITKIGQKDSNLSTLSSAYKKISDITYKFTNNSFILSGMFFNCSSLISLPDISGWNINNVSGINFMFYNCSSLKSLPDISNWNINNVTDIGFTFYNCSSLISLPDI